MYKNILVEIEDGIAVITLDKPEKLNAWDGPMRKEVGTALEALNGNPAVGAIIMTGAGDRAFSAGQDLAETEKLLDGAAGAEWSKTWKDFYHLIRGLDKPLIAALNGVAAGSAFQVALLADVRVGHDGSAMGQPEINAGIPSTTGPWIMNERLGMSRTIELTLTGRMMSGAEAHQIGLIHYLVPPGYVMAKAREIARLLASKPPGALRANKRHLQAMTQAGFEFACETGRETQAAAFAGGEPQAAMRAFFEARAKRKKA